MSNAVLCNQCRSEIEPGTEPGLEFTEKTDLYELKIVLLDDEKTDWCPICAGKELAKAARVAYGKLRPKRAKKKD